MLVQFYIAHEKIDLIYDKKHITDFKIMIIELIKSGRTKKRSYPLYICVCVYVKAKKKGKKKLQNMAMAIHFQSCNTTTFKLLYPNSKKNGHKDYSQPSYL